MKRHLNTLFVTTQGSYLAKERESVLVRADGEVVMRLPVHNLDGIICFGQVGASPALMGLCAERGVAISFLTERGRLLGRVVGFTGGNVLLRREQYRRADDPLSCIEIARSVILAKLGNSRSVMRRAIRDHGPDVRRLQEACARTGRCIRDARVAPSLDVLRGAEGEGARAYFGAFNEMITSTEKAFHFSGRTRRPPKDPVNAMLSFLYSVLAHDVRSAAESVGLDPAVGFLHRDRPGRPGLALDLMEEFRAFIADRVVLSVINRNQVSPRGFITEPTGAIRMTDETRKTLLVSYQQRKQGEIMHPFLNEETTVGMLPHLQALLMARFLRGDMGGYPPFLSR